MPMLFLLFVIPTANLMILGFLSYYLYNLQKQKKDLETRLDEVAIKESEVDKDFHQNVDQSLAQEKKIIADAAQQAKTILTDTKFVSDSSKEVVDQALEKMVKNVEEETSTSSVDIVNKHKTFLSQISEKSLDNFQSITKKFEEELQKQIQDFRESLLPGVQKEIEVYKQQQFKEAQGEIERIVQEVSQKVLNKGISLEDHQSLIIKSLEKARNEGIFD